MGLAYERLLDRCQRQNWDVGLFHGRQGFTLEVRRDGELLARNRSTLSAPEAFDRMAVSAVVSLERQR